MNGNPLAGGVRGGSPPMTPDRGSRIREAGMSDLFHLGTSRAKPSIFALPAHSVIYTAHAVIEA